MLGQSMLHINWNKCRSAFAMVDSVMTRINSDYDSLVRKDCGR